MFLKKLKALVTELKSWSPAETRKYDIWLVILILFIFIYGITMYVYTERAAITTPSVLNVNIGGLSGLTNNVIVVNSLIFDTNQTNKFVVGEWVSVRGFNIVGVVTRKTLTLNGHTYEVMYNNGGSIEKETFDDWMLTKVTQLQQLLR